MPPEANPLEARLRDLFAAVLEKQDAEERRRYLDEACNGDPMLRSRVESLLRAHERADHFLEHNVHGEEIDADMEVVGSMIGPYRLIERLGVGGFGVVYRAEQTRPIRREVALKIIKLGMDTRAVIARFEAERQALALMDHPNIARVFDAGATDTGRPYFVMELVRGTKFTDYCDEHCLSTEERLNLFAQVCHAIQHAHQKGIIHRDIKPSNILVTVNDGVPVPKVIDFGIAKAIGQQLTDKTVHTAFEQFIGTPAYVSPEQASMTSLDIDTRSDIYALGVLLYELLTGHTPFEQQELIAAGLDEMRHIIREREPARPSTRVSTLTGDEQTTVAKRRHSDPPQLLHLLRGDLDWIVMKCLEKDRTRRYETANGLATDIARHLQDEPVTARPPGRVYRLQKLVRRNKLVFAAGAVVATALIIGLGCSVWLLLRERAAHARAVAAEQAQSQLRQQAQAEAKKSQQIARIWKDMLNGVGPAVAMGRDTTMLKEILDKTAERIGRDLKDQPEVEIELKNTIGAVYSELGQSEKAERMHREALELARKLPVKRGLEVAASLDGLALTSTRDDLSTRESMEREALAIRLEVLGDQHPEVAASLNHLGIILMAQGKFEESEAMQRQALVLRKKVLGDQTADVALSTDNLGNLYYELQRPVKAETMYRQALALARRVLGDEHPAVAVYLNDLALVLDLQGKPAEGEPFHRQAVALQRRLLGSSHPTLLNSLAGLADSLWTQGRFAEADDLYREALEAGKAIGGSNQHATAITGNKLAAVLRLEGKLEQANTLTQETLELEKKLSDQERIEVAGGLDRQAFILLRGRGRLADAEALEHHVLALLREICPSAARDGALALSLDHLGYVLRLEGRAGKIEPLYREALALQRGLPPSDGRNSELAALLADLASTVNERGDPREAEVLCREAVTLLRASAHGLGDTVLVRPLAALADALRAEGRLAEAEPLYREALSFCRQLAPENLDQTQWVASGLAATLQSGGKLAEAEACYRESVTNAVRFSPNDSSKWQWQVSGLLNVLQRQGKNAEADQVKREFLTRPSGTNAPGQLDRK